MVAVPEITGFRDLRPVGVGGAGAVFAAVEEAFDRDVAIKVLTKGPKGLRHTSFQKECLALGQLAMHTSIVDVYSAGIASDSSPYLAMRLYQGSLLDRVNREGSLSEQEVVHLGIQIAGALAYAHERGVVHRDIKLENILLDEHGDAVLADFGIASMAGAVGPLDGVSAAYAAPEVLAGGERSETSDVYSLGAVLLAALDARLPGERTRAVESDAGEVRSIVSKLMSSSPQERPAAARVATALRAVQESAGWAATVVAAPSPVVPSDTTISWNGPDPARRRRLAAVGALVLLAVSLGAASAWLRTGSGGLDQVQQQTLAAILRGESANGANLAGFGLQGQTLTGVDFVGANLDSADLRDADLTGANLSGATLVEADLTGADLTGAALNDADLSGARLERTTLARSNARSVDFAFADLTDADLDRARLSGSNLSWATASGATFVGTLLTSVEFFEADLVGADLEAAVVSGANLGSTNVTADQVAEMTCSDTTVWPATIGNRPTCRDEVALALRAKGTRIEGADLRGQRFDAQSMVRSHLDGADLRGASFVGADLEQSSLRNADLAEADLRRADLDDTDMVGADARRADLRSALLRGAQLSMLNLTDARLSNADLSGADLSGAMLAGADLDGIVCDDATVWPSIEVVQALGCGVAGV